MLVAEHSLYVGGKYFEYCIHFSLTSAIVSRLQQQVVFLTLIAGRSPYSAKNICRHRDGLLGMPMALIFFH